MTKFRLGHVETENQSNVYKLEVLAFSDDKTRRDIFDELRYRIESNDGDLLVGRQNGKTKYFSDWMRDTLNAGNIAYATRFGIKQVIFNNPATIVFWADGTKTVVKCQDGDVYSPETGIAMCFMKKALGNKSNFNNTFKKHVPSDGDSAKQISGRYKWNANNGKKKPTKKYAHLNTEAVYRLLRENKSSVPELAKSVGVDRTAVYGWLRGGGIKKRNISKLIKVLHVPEEVIIKEEN